MRRLVVLASLLAMIAQPVLALDLTPRGVFRHGGFGKSASEITAYDPATKRLFVVNGEAGAIDVLDIADIDAPKKLQSFSLTTFGGAPNSVAVKNGVVAAALDGKDKQGPGQVVFFKAADLTLLGDVEVGAMPDMVTFTPDGRYVLAANEGEPDPNDMGRDPEGAVAVIDVSKGFDKATARLADFRAFNAAAIPGSKPGRPGASFAQAAEPEYIAVSADGATAFVTLQEVNALAIVDIAAARVTAVKGLGFKSWETCPADLSDKDGGIAIKAHPKVFGMYQPDAIATFRSAGRTWLVTANEGDAQGWKAFNEEKRVKDLKLDPAAFPEGSQADAALGRLKTSTTIGDADGDGDLDAVYSFGARSISVWSTEGDLVADSCDQLEQAAAKRGLAAFNLGHDEPGVDSRSDDKGPEPEGVAVGELGGKPYAFVGLERDGGIAVFDLSDPKAPTMVAYAATRKVEIEPSNPDSGDQGPEGVLFIPAAASPNGAPLLVVSYEVSGTTRIWEVSR
jgi:hypothetical protein